MNNFIKILDLLKKKGGFLFCHCEPPVREAWQSLFKNNEIGFANTFSNPLGWRTRLLRRFAPRNDNQASCHCEPSAPQKAWQSLFLGVKKKGDCFLSLVMTRRLCRFVPSSDNAEDRELEGVPNVMELYTLFPNPFLFAIIYSIFRSAKELREWESLSLSSC
jgi:hypothetical protein